MEIAVIDGARNPDDLGNVQLAFLDRDVIETGVLPGIDTEIRDKFAKIEVRHLNLREDKDNKIARKLALFKNRIILFASGENMTAEQLWEAIKTMDVASIID